MPKKQKIKTWKQLEKYQNNVDLPQVPYYRNFSIDSFGCFDIHDTTSLAPEEALRLGRFLVEFYEGAGNESN